MKKIFIIALLAGLSWSCTSGSGETSDTDSTKVEQVIDTCCTDTTHCDSLSVTVDSTAH